MPHVAEGGLQPTLVSVRSSFG